MARLIMQVEYLIFKKTACIIYMAKDAAMIINNIKVSCSYIIKGQALNVLEDMTSFSLIVYQHKVEV